jgi:hypothetical protein
MYREERSWPDHISSGHHQDRQNSPVIAGMPTTGCMLWPPNHKLVQVANVTAADALSGIASGSFKVTGASNEAIDPSDPAIVITPNGLVDSLSSFRRMG